MTVVLLPRRIVRPLAWIGGIAVAGGACFLVDSGIAMNAEHQLAQEVKSVSQLDQTPRVYIGGTPYVGAALTKEIPLLEVNAYDIEIPNLGLVSASTTLRDITVEPSQIFSSEFENAEISTYSRAVSLDGVSLGGLLGINDLSIANPKNISPSGGAQSAAELTGTLPGADERSSVIVSLRLMEGTFHMTPVEILETGGASEDDIRDTFTFELETQRLPLSGQATAVRQRGGSVIFETQKRNVELRIAELSPVDIDNEY